MSIYMCKYHPSFPPISSSDNMVLLSYLFIHDRPKSAKVPAQNIQKKYCLIINIEQNSSFSGPRRKNNTYK